VIAPKKFEIVGNGAQRAAVEGAERVGEKVFGALGQETAERLGRYTVRLVIVPLGKQLTDLPDFAYLKGKPTFDADPGNPRTYDELRGVGGQLQGNTIVYGLAEEELANSGSFYGFDHVGVHESGHIVFKWGLTDEQRAQVVQLFQAHSGDGNAEWLKPEWYTKSNVEEYFANSVAAYFGASYSPLDDPGYSKSWLREHDPGMFSLLQSIFRPPTLLSYSPDELLFNSRSAYVNEEATTATPATTAPLAPLPAPDPAGRPPRIAPPESTSRRRVVRFGVLVGVVVAVVIAGLLALMAGGGDDGGNGAGAGPKADKGAAVRTPASTAVAATASSAELPGTLTFTATKTATVVPPPEPLQPAPVGRSFTSTMPIVASCTGGKCTYTSKFNTGPGLVRGPVPDVAWTHDGTHWRVTLTAPLLSNSTNGADCVYQYTDTFDLVVTSFGQRGAQTVATGFTGTLRREGRMDPVLSKPGIDAKSCLPYQSVDDYAVTATGA
jgi:hypothetical protein